ncbi:GNAT family N-acetyltransferase [Pontibacter qinzhouensis]|uniref:GNAT family N-acetyltransferase n=1 Tax=Pontibacter qinzhouensis TaxID=2603253 RepID=A0A5C8KCX6_9BACT|nr:GNAT family N-acetyltransferase [Pontibacter qinzhouensis]TXK50867.1 GNAT family N-acetyltransferase [Pontibacter qinzhouensis]
MLLKSDHTYLRALEPVDLDFLYTLENDTRVWQVGNTLMPYSRFVLEQYLENAALDIFTVKQLRLVICTHNHKAVGAIDLFDFEPLHQRAGIGIVIAGPERGKGYAAEALQVLLEYGRQILQLHQVYCSVTADNEASLHLFQKAGFAEIGVRRQWLRTPTGWQDVVDFQKLL